MEKKFDLIATVVTFKNPIGMLEELTKSFYRTKLQVKLVFIDNSDSDSIKEFALINNVEYMSGHGNVGFGAGHNLGIKKFANQAEYFLILNPDIVINNHCLSDLYSFMNKNQSVPMCSPLILNPDGSIQFVHKRLPKISHLFARRFFVNYLGKRYKKDLSLFVLEDQLPFEKPLQVPILSGCFMFFRSESLVKLGGFDESFFMYMEDFDLSRRSSDLGPNVFVPYCSVYHEWGRGSHKNFKLLWINIKSVLYYFFKWGFSVKNGDSTVKLFQVKE